MIFDINIIDCTLREGNQAPKVSFSPNQSRVIAKSLSSIGVQTIEIGHPYASELEMNRVKAVTSINLGCDVLAHARAKECDIEAVAKSGAQWVGIFAGINELSQKYRLNKSKEEILGLIESSVSFAKSLKLKVRYTVEDSSRTPMNLLIQAYETAINAGADRICFADTVGVLEPKEAFKRIRSIRKVFPYTPIEIHFHDDRGLALANVIAAVDAGATWISSSVNGLGERCGIPDTCAVITNFYFKNRMPLKSFSSLKEISELIGKISNFEPDSRRPVIGKHAFMHTAKLHKDSINKNKDTYTWFDLGGTL